MSCPIATGNALDELPPTSGFAASGPDSGELFGEFDIACRVFVTDSRVNGRDTRAEVTTSEVVNHRLLIRQRHSRAMLSNRQSHLLEPSLEVA